MKFIVSHFHKALYICVCVSTKLTWRTVVLTYEENNMRHEIKQHQ